MTADDIIKLIKDSAPQEGVTPSAQTAPGVAVYGTGVVTVASGGVVHIHHHHYAGPADAQTAPNPEQT